MKRKGPGTQFGTQSHPYHQYHSILFILFRSHSGLGDFVLSAAGEPKERGESITVKDKVDELQGPTLTPKELSLLQL